MVNGTIKLNEKYDLIWATEDDIREIFAAYKMYADNTEYTYHNCPANRNKGLSDYQKETVLRSKMFYYKEDFFVLKDREGNVMGITSISNNHPETDILEITTLLVPEEILEQVLIGCEQLLKSLYPFNISKLRIKTIGSDLEMLEKQLFNCGFKKVSQLMDEYGKGIGIGFPILQSLGEKINLIKRILEVTPIGYLDVWVKQDIDINFIAKILIIVVVWSISTLSLSYIIFKRRDLK